jgi:predicted deacetylase
MKVLVSIHDVTPAHADAVTRLWRMCAVRNVRPALLVVPDWHGSWPIDRYSSFVTWVRRRADEGCEVFLHGNRHDEVGSPRGLVDHARAFSRTNREGEFLTLSAGAARARMEHGLSRLRRVGLDPIGFVAPAWLARRECVGVASELDLAVSEDAGAIYLHRRGMHLDSPVVRWSARSAWRAYTSAAVADASSWWHRGHWLVRIALHPSDLSHPATASSVETTLDHWLGRRLAWSYSAL